jgi:hypothetical protein
MLRTLVISSFVLTLTTGNLAALEAEDVEDIFLGRAVVESDPPGLPEDSSCLGFMVPQASGFFEVPHNDTLASSLFVVPKGTSLIITSFQWQSFDGDGTPTRGDRTHTATITGLLPDPPGGKSFKFIGRTLAPSGIADLDGGVGSSIVMPTGIVFPAGAHICMQVGSSLSPYEGEAVGFIQGFLVKDKRE